MSKIAFRWFVDKVEARTKLSFPNLKSPMSLWRKGYMALDFSNSYQNPLEALMIFNFLLDLVFVKKIKCHLSFYFLLLVFVVIKYVASDSGISLSVSYD